MMMKRFSFCTKKLFFCTIFTLVCFVAFSTDNNWTLAAQKFNFTQKDVVSDSDLSASKTLPVLILEQVSENLFRNTHAEERLDRKLYELQKQRISLFMQLSKEVKTRDSLVLGNYSKRKLASKIKESQKKIEKIQNDIQANIDACKEEEKKASKQIEKDKNLIDEENDKKDSFLNLLKDLSSENEYEKDVVENVVLYQNDFNKLFSAGDKLEGENYSSFDFQQAVVNAGINGLITGTITKFNQYISVNATLYQYPAAKIIGSAVDVGSITDLKTLAVSIARQLTPKITDNMPIELFFSVEPKEVLKDITITVDDVVYKEIPEKVIVQNGIHSFVFAAEGYSTLSTSYSFAGNQKYKIDVTMAQEKQGVLNLRLQNMFKGDIYANGNYSGVVNDEQRFSSIKINNNAILGRFISEDGYGADFYVPQKLIVDNNFVKVNAKPFDRSDYIEKRRRYMYTSYSIFIVSLIPSFYTYGNYHSIATAYNAGADIEYQTAKNWQMASNISMGVSIGCAGFFIYELIRYLNAANSVLPATAKVITPKELKQLEEKDKKYIEEKRLKEQEEQLLLEAKQQEDEISSEEVASDETETSEIIVEISDTVEISDEPEVTQ